MAVQVIADRKSGSAGASAYAPETGFWEISGSGEVVCFRAIASVQERVSKGRWSGRHRHASLKSLREPSFQKLSEFCCRLELRNRL